MGKKHALCETFGTMPGANPAVFEIELTFPRPQRDILTTG